MSTTAALSLAKYIVSKELRVGAKLPSIKDLADLFHLNKNQVKTGLTTLEALGVIDIHPRAGAFVKHVSPADLNTLLMLFYRFGLPGEGNDITQIYSVKTVLDREIFMNATRYRTENDLYKLESNLHRQSQVFADIPAFIDADEEYHRYLSQIARNPLMDFFQEAVAVLIRPFRMANLTPAVNEQSYRGHVALLGAIKTKNVREAERLAEELTMPRLRILREENARQQSYDPL